MLIGGKEYKTGQRIKVINAKSILHYKYGMTRDCNKDMTGITGVITAESTYDEYARANLRVEVKELLRAFLSDELRLDLNNKTTIRPCSMGVDFVGFRIWSTHRRLKKKTAVKIKRNLKNQIAKVKAGEERKDRLDRSVASYRGILSHFNSYGLRQSLNTLFKENGMVEKKEEVSRCTGNCNNCPNYTESYFCGFATPYCKLQGKEITHNVY